MHRSDFSFNLPAELIAQYPAEPRGESRLLCLDKDSGGLTQYRFRDIVELIDRDDLLVLNDTRVIPARLFGVKDTGGKVEILVERLLDKERLLAQVRASKSPRPGTKILIAENTELEVEGRLEDFYILRPPAGISMMQLLNEYGHVPLPPYIQRDDEERDFERYQTVYARRPGAVAAPTAGLHFTENILLRLRDKGTDIGYVTLHVGAGTFQPVRTDQIEDHRMHSEWFMIDETLCGQVDSARKRGGRIIAVGTTVVRCLEAATSDDGLEAMSGETNIFIYPGYRFRAVDALITNFHLPESTLLMLVCAFAGRDNVLNAYRYAVEEGFRFFSYGDAMFIY